MIALNVSISYDYQVNIFDCTEFTLELAHRLKSIGYDVRFAQGRYLDCKYGWSNGTYNTCRHDWLQVKSDKTTYNIEPQTGEILTAERFKSNYRMYWSTPCIKCMEYKY